MSVRGAPITNLENFLNRDCVILQKGDSVTFKINAALASAGWTGGTLVRWVVDGSGEPCLGLGNGLFAGYLPFGSNESGDQYTSMTRQNPHYHYAVLHSGGIVATTTYERHTYASRHAGPLVPLVYTPNQTLYVSENGKLTPEDESDAAINPGGLFPDGSPILAPFQNVASCMLPPALQPQGYLFAQFT